MLSLMAGDEEQQQLPPLSGHAQSCASLLNRIPASGHQPLPTAFPTFSVQNFVLSLVSLRLPNGASPSMP